jgi:hypothetical protein
MDELRLIQAHFQTYPSSHIFHGNLDRNKADSFAQLCTIEQNVYGYRPSIPANVSFAVLFSLGTIVHVILGVKWKTWWFMWCMILGCTHEVVGYIGRVLLYKNPWNFGAFIAQISMSP